MRPGREVAKVRGQGHHVVRHVVEVKVERGPCRTHQTCREETTGRSAGEALEMSAFYGSFALGNI